MEDATSKDEFIDTITIRALDRALLVGNERLERHLLGVLDEPYIRPGQPRFEIDDADILERIIEIQE